MRGGGSGSSLGPSDSQLKVFVGGLAQHTTKESLNAHFTQFGPADSIIMMDRATGRSRGFGFVDFQDERAMDAALSTSHEVDGVRVSVSAYAEKQGMPQQQQQSSRHGGRGASLDVSAAAADILNNTVGLVAKL